MYSFFLKKDVTECTLIADLFFLATEYIY